MLYVEKKDVTFVSETIRQFGIQRSYDFEILCLHTNRNMFATVKTWLWNVLSNAHHE